MGRRHIHTGVVSRRDPGIEGLVDGDLAPEGWSRFWVRVCAAYSEKKPRLERAIGVLLGTDCWQNTEIRCVDRRGGDRDASWREGLGAGSSAHESPEGLSSVAPYSCQSA